MSANPRIRRLALVPFEGPDDQLRRYRLARMDEIALATPPDPSLAERSSGDSGSSTGGEGGGGVTPPAEPPRPA